MSIISIKPSKNLSIVFLILTILFLYSCTGINEEILDPDDSKIEENVYPIQEEVLSQETIEDTPTTASDEINDQRRNIPVISITNTHNLQLEKTIHPYFPEIIHLAGNGTRTAIGDLKEIRVIDNATGEILLEVDISLPSCNFGMDRYFQLNFDGSFLAIASRETVQVWQVGGGMIYEEPYANGHYLDNSLCGADIPQFSLSPNGELLAISGKNFELSEAKSFFRIINIIENSTIYEWNGKSETLHGQLYAFPGLGFSPDGNIVQVFDPSRFNKLNRNYRKAFRFWSAGDWVELDASGELVRDTYSAGDMQIGVFVDNSIQVFSKNSGGRIGELKNNRCRWDEPCQTRFSSNGEYTAVLIRDNPLQYKRESLWKDLLVFDIS